mmetsp:Transcript_36675/g.86064  ORF Transcript_36675/g.86064 Transcript_36675/m.86064 type:complete len:206 (+) Transcript_36675:357-974(+)
MRCNMIGEVWAALGLPAGGGCDRQKAVSNVCRLPLSGAQVLPCSSGALNHSADTRVQGTFDGVALVDEFDDILPDGRKLLDEELLTTLRQPVLPLRSVGGEGQIGKLGSKSVCIVLCPQIGCIELLDLGVLGVNFGPQRLGQRIPRLGALHDRLGLGVVKLRLEFRILPSLFIQLLLEFSRTKPSLCHPLPKRRNLLRRVRVVLQ